MSEKKILGSRYLLVKQLGRGSFGQTYLAKDTMLPGDPECVVKKLHPIFKDSEMLNISRRLFASEAEALQKLGDRERIPQLLAYFEEDKEFYLVMQYVAGHSLNDELIPDRAWPEAKVIKVLKDCLHILDYVHSRGVIHRDIKPANLICRQEDNKLILVDFGAVKEVILAESIILSQLTVGIGTRGYMPEEQANGNPVFNSDIYALGVIGIQALSGCNPLKLKKDRQRELIWQPRSQVSPDLVEIISKMTRCDCQQRYQSAREVITALNRFPDNTKETTRIFENADLSKIINSEENDIYNPFIGREPTLIPQDLSAIDSFEQPEQILEESSPKMNENNNIVSPKVNQHFLIGKTLENGKYRIEKKLGEGGFGITFKATDLIKNEPVAIKTIKKGASNSSPAEKQRKQFLDEARRLVKCQHPNIVRYRYFFVENDRPFIVMNYIFGETLDEIVSPTNPLSEEIAIKYIRQIGEALKVIHRNGLLHRDVKPQNLILNPETQQVILIDFGIAREFLQGKTQIHTHLTSDGYSPLEQYFPKAKRSSATDVYSLAATLYTLLTGEIPIPSILRDRIPMSSPKEQRSNLSHKVNQAVMTGMTIEAKDRPATIDEWLNLLPNSETEKNNTSNSSLLSEQIEFARQELANHVGPLSTFIIRETIRKNPQITLPQLIEKLAAEIPDSDRAKQFTTIIKKISSKTEINHAPVSPEQIELAQQELANYVGPLSTFIVREALTENSQITLEKLIEKLAAEIPNPEQAEQFTIACQRSIDPK